MDVFESGNDLVRQEKDCLQREFPIAEVEQISQAWAEQVENHGIRAMCFSNMMNKWDTDSTRKRLVNMSFMLNVRFDLDRKLTSRDGICRLVDVTANLGIDTEHAEIEILAIS